MNPCGHIVDVLRSCYACDLRTFHDDPTKKTRVQWYFVPESRPTLPYPSAFGTRVWELEELDPDIGELNEPRPWRGGLPPANVSTGGLCGSAEQWAHGCSSSDALPALYPGTLLPTCCAPPIQIALGGTATGAVRMDNFCCTFFPNTYVPARVYFHVTAGIPDEVFPLDWDVPFTGAWSNLTYLCTMMASNDCSTWNFLQFPPPWPAANPLICSPLHFGFTNVRIVHPVHGVVFVDGFVSADP